jgi:hypothetical protein
MMVEEIGATIAASGNRHGFTQDDLVLYNHRSGNSKDSDDRLERFSPPASTKSDENNPTPSTSAI